MVGAAPRCLPPAARFDDAPRTLDAQCVAVLTLRAAAALLAAQGPDSLAEIALACGYEAAPLPLAPQDRAALGLATADGAQAASVRIARGTGDLRALLVDVHRQPAAPALHDIVLRVASRLAREAPHLAWLCIAASRSVGGVPEDSVASTRGTARSVRSSGLRQLILATWSGDRRPPRIAALVVDPDAVVDSDAETLAALAASVSPDGGATHARWLDLLGRESLTRRFYRALDRAVSELAVTLTVPIGHRRPPPEVRRALALLYASRLLFLAFLEAKGWLDGDRAFLTRIYTQCVAAKGGFHHHVLRPLFFGTLNTSLSRRAPAAIQFGRIPFLNGGLFCATPLERRLRRAVFSDAALGAFVGDLLGHYRFTAREDRSTWSEAAIDPEMLGKAFEALMAPAG